MRKSYNVEITEEALADMEQIRFLLRMKPRFIRGSFYKKFFEITYKIKSTVVISYRINYMYY